jgi:NADH-quinone oxidoreductase subunit N
MEAGFVGMAIIGVLNSVISVFYYAKPIRNMYIRKTDTKEKISFGKINMVFVYSFAVPVTLLFLNFGSILA